jgi:pimeloyl-ACP methyl ester carboxylesterase
MTHQLLFVQGGGAGAHDEWDGKLVESLSDALGPTYEIRYPRMPGEDDPSYATWKAMLEKELATLRDGAILVGHSIGGTILINALAESPPEREFGAIFLIAAPFVGEGGWQSDDLKPLRDLGGKLPKGVRSEFARVRHARTRELGPSWSARRRLTNVAADKHLCADVSRRLQASSASHGR